MMADTMTLLPCPFCGSGPDLHTSRIPYSTAIRIRCNCGVQMEWRGSDIDEECVRSGIIAAWNRRHSQGVTVTHDAPQVPAQADPVAWLCEDLILAGCSITQDSHHAERRAGAIFEGKPAWRVTPLYAAPPAPSAWRPIAETDKHGAPLLIGWLDSDGVWQARRAWWDPEFESEWDEKADDTRHIGAWTDGAVKSWGYQERVSYDPTHVAGLPTPPPVAEKALPGAEGGR